LGPAVELGVCLGFPVFVFLLLVSLLLPHLHLPYHFGILGSGHASSSRVQQLVFRGLLGPVSKDNFDCVSCQLGKQLALPFHNSEFMSIGIFDLIHSDVWGPSPINSIGGSRYFVIFVDDYSRYSWVFLMRSHDELLNIYRNFANMVKTQFSKTIKVLRSDNAREFT
jgi:hypothetical protein